MEAWRRRRLVKPSGRFAAVVGSGDDPKIHFRSRRTEQTSGAPRVVVAGHQQTPAHAESSQFGYHHHRFLARRGGVMRQWDEPGFRVPVANSEGNG